MTENDITFLILIVVIAINQFVIRSRVWHKNAFFFWGPQLINISLGTYAILFGLPGVYGPIDIINWIIGGLFLYHFAQNQNRFYKQKRQERQEEFQKSKQEIYDQSNSTNEESQKGAAPPD